MSRRQGQIRGEASEMAVALELIESGHRVSQTFGHSHPYDLIVDVENQLIKIQVKTANTTDDANQYYVRLDDPEKYSRDTVDMFAGYAPDRGTFFVPYDEMGRRSSVTFTPPEEMGSQANRDRANHISEYTFEAVLSRVGSEE